jgi:hypothetical protein
MKYEGGGECKKLLMKELGGKMKAERGGGEERNWRGINGERRNRCWGRQEP